MLKFVALEPVLTQEDTARAARLVSADPVSAVSSAGPQWVRDREATALLDRSAVAFVVAGGEAGIGVLRAERLQTPGVFELALHSADDAALETVGVAAGFDEIVRYLTCTTEVHRIELWFGVYNRLLLDHCLESEHFRCEGMVRDRYFAAGRYWDGLVWSITGPRLRAIREADPAAAEAERAYTRTSARLRRAIRDRLADPEPAS
ncbi:hypothetical protein [Nocardia terpenica]|uniref:GNAT family N-acetyltransferase n=1 Tax=Nocardia terpenica TaxID=455432 RepID=A0A291RDN2_9NOCA|nr:hypothetical protein [Nocardia terpenica]ATL65711.1 hypothetical protein CRH09_05275 [Nocardia terpenica]